MDKLSTGKVMTMQEIANALGVSKDTIRNCVRRVFPDKMQQGKTAYFNEAEVAIISKELKSNAYVSEQLTSEAASQVKNTTTAMELQQNFYQAAQAYAKYLEEEKARLEAENKTLSTANVLLTQANSSLQADKEQLQITCNEQAHALEYSKAIGKKRWSEAKKLYGFRVNIEFIKKNFQKDVDWFSAIMGNDKYPTFWVSDTVINTLIEQE